MRSIGGCRDCARCVNMVTFSDGEVMVLCGYKHQLVYPRRVCLSYRRKEE